MKQFIFFLLSLTINASCMGQSHSIKKISKNKMNVSWNYENERVFFEMSGPTTGWITIGFNDKSGIKGAYLLMGNIIQGKPSVVEHYTLSPRNYKAINLLGVLPQVRHIKGNESNRKTTLKFSLPVHATSKYQKGLFKGSEYTMILAYSQEDDFQHHSIMRTSIHINL